MDSVSTHKKSLDYASISMAVPEDMIEEVTAFIEEPAETASQADVWLRSRPRRK